MTVLDPYEHIVFHGKPLDRAAVAALQVAEEQLGYELTILQGIGGAKASAGTHLEGRCVDLSRYDAEHKVPVLKRLGFFVWERDDLPGVWGEHIHAGLMLNTFDNARGIAPAGFRQIAAYRGLRNGLADNGPDPHPWRPDPIPCFVYPPKKDPAPPKPTRITKVRDKLTQIAADAGHAAALLDDVDEKRVTARAERDDLRAIKRQALASLDRLPKR